MNATSTIKTRSVERQVVTRQGSSVWNYRLHAEISRPVTLDGDPDCQDTYGVKVVVACHVKSDDEPWFHDAQVSEDVRADDGTIVYHEGETLLEQSYTAANRAELNAAFLKQRNAERAGEYDPADERVSSAADNIEPLPAEDFDQRPVLRRAA